MMLQQLQRQSKAQVVALGELVEITQGCPFDSSLFADSGTLPVIRIRDVLPGRSSTYLNGLCDDRYLVNKGEILIGMDGEFNRARWQSETAALNQRVCRIRPLGNRVDDGYLFHLLPQELKKIEDRTPFVTVKHLSVKQINAIQILLPPLPEQRRIAAILDQADALRAKRREALAKLDEMAQAAFQQACEIERGRKLGLYLDDFLAEIQIGPFGSLLHKSDYVEGGVPLINPMHIIDGQIVPNGAYSVSKQKLKELARYRLQEGDIIMGRRGEMGRCAVARGEHVGMVCGTGSMILRCDPMKVAPDFLAEFIRSPHTVQALENASSGVTMANLNQKSLSTIEANIPPMDIQRRYAETTQQLQSEKKRMRGGLDKLDLLFTSLQHRAFSGTL